MGIHIGAHGIDIFGLHAYITIHHQMVRNLIGYTLADLYIMRTTVAYVIIRIIVQIEMLKIFHFLQLLHKRVYLFPIGFI